MPKTPKGVGGLFAEVNRHAAQGPGPEKYHKDIGERSFVQNLRGGSWSPSKKTTGRGLAPLGVVPSVGTYSVAAAIDKTKPRPRGGHFTKHDRKCFFALQAEKSTNPPPGKYDPKRQEAHLDSPVFASPRTQSRSPKKSSPMGPGYYEPSYANVEKSVLTYSGSKDANKSFLDKIMTNKDNGPPPGHVGIPTCRWEDKAGRALHAARLLLDRHVAPRARAIDGASSAR